MSQPRAEGLDDRCPVAESRVSSYRWSIVDFFRPDLVRDGAVAETQATSGL